MECLSMITVKHPPKPMSMRTKLDPGRDGGTFVVPCGKCAFCLVNKRSQWMFRIHHEMRTQNYPGYFLTVTYNEKYVKRVPGVGLSLRFRDIQLWLKQIRKAKYYAKYICVGEYGTKTHRPHYHLLIWTDCPPEKMERIWFRGSIDFGQITMASAMYTLKYIIQPKQREENGLEKTRAQFSRGLGLEYLNKSVYNYHTSDPENPVLFSIIDGRKVALPRYYKNKIFTKQQLHKAGHKAKWDSIRKYRKHVRELLIQGIGDTKTYVKKLRVEQANRIIKNTKFNTTV